MPLHLLGKKSWNVYNADNIARVRRDEAAAQAAEEAEEQRMQEVDAQRRLAILRGDMSPPPPLPEKEGTPSVKAVEGRQAHGSSRRKRKRPGEDDTDFELRIANERYESRPDGDADLKRKTSSAPITDDTGHIDLFGDERARSQAEGDEEAEKEAKKRKQEFEDQYTMRFANAAGRDGVQQPWYSNSGDHGTTNPMKNVWGRDDPQRREREVQRIASNDPLAMMKLGASKARQVNHERKRMQEERDAELRQLRREQEHAERRRRRRARNSRSSSPRAGDGHHRGRTHRTSCDRDSSNGHRRHRHGREHHHRRRRRSRSPRESSGRTRSRDDDYDSDDRRRTTC